MNEGPSFHSELSERIDWLVRLRWFAVAGSLAAILAGNALFPGQLAVGPLLTTVAAIAVYNLVFLLQTGRMQRGDQLEDRWHNALRLSGMQIVLDLVALATLLHFSGGIENPCAMFFVLHVIIASVLLPRRLSFAVAGLASFLVTSLALLEYTQVIAHFPLPGLEGLELHRRLSFLLVSTSSVVATLFASVYIASSISNRLRLKEAELLSSSRAVASRSRELEAATSRLKRIDEERTRFMMLVSHELRAPLNTIFSVLDLATSGFAPVEQSQEMLLRAKRRVTEMLELINELLMLARAIEEEFRAEERQLTQLGDLLTDVAKLMRVEAESKDLLLGVEVAPDAPPVWVNPDRMKLVWTNLLSNAIKYTEPGGIIVASLTVRTGAVRGSVRDTGIGIADDDQSKIFSDFFRTKNARAVSPMGTGIGLSLVKRIVENAGGRIWLRSELGMGSEFVFELPWAG